MKVGVTGCLHGHLPEVKECDLLVITGDISPVQDHRVAAQRLYLENEFKDWLARIPAKNVVGVAGNHDFVFEDFPEVVPSDLKWTYLQDSGTEAAGLKIWGTPWTPVFGRWGFMQVEDDLKKTFEAIPEGLDILVSHGPPFGLGDMTHDGLAVGSTSLLEAVNRAKPKLHLFSHIHEGLGVYQNADTFFVNASYLNIQYLPYRSGVIYFELGENGGINFVS